MIWKKENKDKIKDKFMQIILNLSLIIFCFQFLKLKTISLQFVNLPQVGN